MNTIDSIVQHPRGSRERRRAIVEVTRQRRETAHQIHAEVHGDDPGITDLTQGMWEVDPIRLSPADLDRINAAAVNLLHEAIPEMNQRQLNTLADDLDALARSVERRLDAAETAHQGTPASRDFRVHLCGVGEPLCAAETPGEALAAAKRRCETSPSLKLALSRLEYETLDQVLEVVGPWDQFNGGNR
ncbi:hypothetical protein [Ectothiorhodospira variabilis]|uniref:hypothetical protein n=1 Tax=Ectothiorhodospira variabilis TaxID=505694 RepID=UPI001EFAD999|nr:hypothetical protein [Ectothiorhodospira variabilis]MCG5495634.1 hypothetical protein [Ectothiorhodospira variabilis]MCG5504695.1 hypothetical protein [Ectothiorhodospira variabilis]MCG5507852.1 hypothetical protein [Ectothiorhodospira variabilis]